MNVNSIASLATSMASSRTDQAIGIAVLKKALDAETQTATALISALPASPGASLPSNLGQNINTTA